MDDGGCKTPHDGGLCNWSRPGRDGYPINCIDLREASAFADWAGARVPNEAEWETAALGGGGFDYAGSDRVDEVAWYRDNSGGGSRAVCRKQANDYDLCDMSGNVSEWTSAGPGSSPIIRGGSWHDSAKDVRLTTRRGSGATGRSDTLGFRVVR